jgi:type IV pilus assembly protein PilC
MPKFAYAGIGPDGASTNGVLDSASADTAHAVLVRRGLREISLSQRKSFWTLEITPKKVKREEVMHLSRQLAAFVRAGIPITDAVSTLAEEATNHAVRRVMLDIGDGLRVGDTLSDCIERHPHVFPDFFRGIVRAAELTGRLDVALDQLAGYLERDLEARRKIRSALIYPAIVAVLAIITVTVLATFVLPQFKKFFASLSSTNTCGARKCQLPLPTRMLLNTTGFLGHWWFVFLGSAALIALLILLMLRTEAGRFIRDRIVLRIPVVGDTIRHALTERFCRLLGSMVGAGVSLPEALAVATEALRNLVYTRALAGVQDSMLEGQGLASPISHSGVFPATATQMIRVGEDTGTLDEQLGVAAAFYDRELDYKIKRLTSLVEPIVITVMGLIVGFVAVALVSAMYGIFRQVKV